MPPTQRCRTHGEHRDDDDESPDDQEEEEASGRLVVQFRPGPVVFWLMVGVPTFLHVLLVWVPTLASIFLSFTDWKGIRFSDINWVGFLNYEQIFTVFEKDFFQAVINNRPLLVFLFLGPTLLRHVPRLPARQGTRGQPHLPERVLHAGRAVAGRRRVHVADRRSTPPRTAWPPTVRWRRSGRLDRQPVVPDPVRRQLRHLARTSSRSSSRSPGGTPATSWCSTSPG